METVLIQKRGILVLLSAPGRYIKRKVKTVYRKLVKKRIKKTAKGPNILEMMLKSCKEVKWWIKRDC